jgi:hypothetical protein
VRRNLRCLITIEEPCSRETYRSDGFIVLPNMLTTDAVAALRRLTDGFVEEARQVTANNDIFDLEDTHSTGEPRVRWIKTRHLRARNMRAPSEDRGAARGFSGTVRSFDTRKLNRNPRAMACGGRSIFRATTGTFCCSNSAPRILGRFWASRTGSRNSTSGRAAVPMRLPLSPDQYQGSI